MKNRMRWWDNINPICFIVPPLITPFQFDGPANAGDSVQIACYVSKGDIPLRIEWHFQGDGMSSHAMGVRTAMFGEKANILAIDSVGPGNRGEYTCTASNLAGVANHSTILLVNGEICTSFTYALFLEMLFCSHNLWKHIMLLPSQHLYSSIDITSIKSCFILHTKPVSKICICFYSSKIRFLCYKKSTLIILIL